MSKVQLLVGTKKGAFIMKAILSIALVMGVCGLARAADKVEPAGTWKCEWEITGQKGTATLTIKKNGDKLAGTMSWPDQKETSLKDPKLKDAILTFSAVRKFRDNDYPLDFTLTIDGDKLSGKAVAKFGGQEFEMSAKRQK